MSSFHSNLMLEVSSEKHFTLILSPFRQNTYESGSSNARVCLRSSISLVGFEPNNFCNIVVPSKK